jgi:hypothetical protein
MFTEKQVRQFYVATSTSADVIAPVKVDNTHKATDLTAKSAGACQFVTNTTGDEAYLLYKGPSEDGLQRSDLLKKCNITAVSLTDAADMKHKMLKMEVALDSNVSATPIVGQDYILNIEVKGYIAPGDDSTFRKFGAAHAFNTTASDLYRDLALSLAKNFANLGAPLISVALKTDSDPVAVTNKTAKASLTGTYTGIIIEEVEQPWRRGAAKQEFVNFTVMPDTVYTGGADQVWGTVTDVTASNSNALPNSKKVADMEYFFHKERGDVYGDVGFPNNIETTYQVDPANADGYSFVDINFYFEGNSHNVGKSEKTLTIVGTKSNLKKLIGTATSGSETGLYALLLGTGVTPKTSASW